MYVSVSTRNFNFTGSDNFCCLNLLAALKHSVYVQERTIFHTKILRIVRCMMFLLIIKTVVYLVSAVLSQILIENNLFT